MNAVLSSVAMLGSFMALLLAAFLAILPSRTRTANALLAFFLFATAVDISGWFMADWWNAYPKINDSRSVFVVLQMPFFTGFIWFSCFQERRLRARDTAHLLPGLLVLGLIVTDTSMKWLRLLFELQYFVYIGIAIFILWRFNRLMKARFVKRSTSWRWLALLVASSLFAHCFFIIRTVISPNLPSDLSLALQALAALLILAVTLWIAFQALLQPDLFRGGDRQLASTARAMNEGLTNEHELLVIFMEEHRPFLDPDLSLSRLARSSGMTVKDLSALINQRHGLHFFDFINRYRIDHAKTLLVETEQNVTDIIYASGFNAKSSFNAAFRKYTGTTPSTYRRDQVKK